MRSRLPGGQGGEQDPVDIRGSFRSSQAVVRAATRRLVRKETAMTQAALDPGNYNVSAMNRKMTGKVGKKEGEDDNETHKEDTQEEKKEKKAKGGMIAQIKKVEKSEEFQQDGRFEQMMKNLARMKKLKKWLSIIENLDRRDDIKKVETLIQELVREESNGEAIHWELLSDEELNLMNKFLSKEQVQGIAKQVQTLVSQAPEGMDIRSATNIILNEAEETYTDVTQRYQALNDLEINFKTSGFDPDEDTAHLELRQSSRMGKENLYYEDEKKILEGLWQQELEEAEGKPLYRLLIIKAAKTTKESMAKGETGPFIYKVFIEIKEEKDKKEKKDKRKKTISEICALFMDAIQEDLKFFEIDFDPDDPKEHAGEPPLEEEGKDPTPSDHYGLRKRIDLGYAVHLDFIAKSLGAVQSIETVEKDSDALYKHISFDPEGKYSIDAFLRRILEIATSRWVEPKAFKAFPENLELPPGEKRIDFDQRLLAIFKRLPEKIIDPDMRIKIINAGEEFLDEEHLQAEEDFEGHE